MIRLKRQTDRSRVAEPRWGTDYVYDSGELVRIDPAFEFTYHEQEPYKRFKPLVSTYIINNRAPYPSGQLVSTYYDSADTPLPLDELSVGNRDSLSRWYGIKEVDGAVEFIKVVRMADLWANCPNAPGEPWVWASLHDTNGVERPEKDYYVKTPRDEMDPWLEANNIPQPLPESEDLVPWCYGIYYNSDTGEILGVKAYVRHAILPQGATWY